MWVGEGSEILESSKDNSEGDRYESPKMNKRLNVIDNSCVFSLFQPMEVNSGGGNSLEATCKGGLSLSKAELYVPSREDPVLEEET